MLKSHGGTFIPGGVTDSLIFGEEEENHGMGAITSFIKGESKDQRIKDFIRKRQEEKL